jgi:hypothetical protein
MSIHYAISPFHGSTTIGFASGQKRVHPDTQSAVPPIVDVGLYHNSIIVQKVNVTTCTGYVSIVPYCPSVVERAQNNLVHGMSCLLVQAFSIESHLKLGHGLKFLNEYKFGSF